MKLRIKQRIFTLTDNFHVYDEDGEIRYEVEAEFFSLGHHFHVYDKQTGQEVGAIKQRLLTWLPKFDIMINGNVVGTISREFTFFRPKYHVDFRGWEVDGDFLGWDYSARCGDYEVLSVSKELFNWSDTYVMNYCNPADEIPGLMLVLAIDAVNCSKKNAAISIDI